VNYNKYLASSCGTLTITSIEHGVVLLLGFLRLVLATQYTLVGWKTAVQTAHKIALGTSDDTTEFVINASNPIAIRTRARKLLKK
jgi:hypothetical protein